MPKGHKARALLDCASSVPEYLNDHCEEYRVVSVHRPIGFSAMEPLLSTLDAYDRKLGIEREPYETEILMTLDLIERSHRAKEQEKSADRGNRR